MLHAESKRLDELLIRSLALHPGLSGAELHHRLLATRPCTIQGVNHELRKLQRSGVVVKHEGQYSLSIVWAAEFMNLADQIYDHYLTAVPAPYLLPYEGRRKSWHFTYLERANDLKVQIISLLLNHTGERRIFQWHPNPVLTLFRINQSLRIQQLLESSERVAYRIVGNRTPLAKDCLKRWNNRLIVYSDAPSAFESERDRHTTIVGEYVLTLYIDPEFDAAVEELFTRYRSVSEALTDGAFAVLRRRSKFKVTLEHSKRRAAELRHRFIEYFGIKEGAGR